MGEQEREEGGRQRLLLLLPLRCTSCSISFLTLMLPLWPFHSCQLCTVYLTDVDHAPVCTQQRSSYLISVTSAGWF